VPFGRKKNQYNSVKKIKSKYDYHHNKDVVYKCSNSEEQFRRNVNNKD